MLISDCFLCVVWDDCEANAMEPAAFCIICWTAAEICADMSPSVYIYLHPTAGQLTIQWGLRWSLLLSVLADEHGRGEAVRPWRTSDRQVERKALWWSSAFHTSMTSWLLRKVEEEERHVTRGEPPQTRESEAETSGIFLTHNCKPPEGVGLVLDPVVPRLWTYWKEKWSNRRR